MSKDHLSRVRRICLSFPEATEKEAWGAPTFRVRNRGLADAVTRSLRRKLPKNDHLVFEVERRVDRRQPRLKSGRGRVEAWR